MNATDSSFFVTESFIEFIKKISQSEVNESFARGSEVVPFETREKPFERFCVLCKAGRFRLVEIALRVGWFA